MYAQSAPLDVGGYCKYLFIAEQFKSEKLTVSHGLHSRVNSVYYFSEAFRAHFEARMRAFTGAVVVNNPSFSDGLNNPDCLWKNSMFLWKRQNSVGHVEIDRLYGSYTTRHTITTLGRQRITWGTALVWNVIDLYNPKSVLDIDYEELPSADAAHIQYFPAEQTSIAFVFKPSTVRTKSIVTAKVQINVFDYDIHVVAGRNGTLYLGGIAWAGDIAGAGFRGELLIQQKPADILLSHTRETVLVNGVLSADYTFQNSLYLHVELLYQNAGVKTQAKYYYPLAQSLGLLSPARLSFFQELSMQLTPLIRAGLFGILNPYDHSLALVPSFLISVTNNMDFSLYGVQLSGGNDTEFGPGHTLVYGRLRYSF